MLDLHAVFRPWYELLLAETGSLDLYDAHTHVGRNDPDGFRQEPEELIRVLAAVDARGVVFPMHEPDGYPPANDRVLAAAEASGGRLVAFCRVDPRDDAVAEARRCLDGGARGIKLHPRAERFDLSEPAVRDLVALAHERRVPVLIHAGRGIPALGRDTVRLSADFPDARLILAHAAVSDLAWLWRVLPEHPNVFIDTSWWSPGDLMALFALAPPASVLFASDSPYGLPMVAAVQGLRVALQAGYGAEQVRGMAGGQLARLLDGREPADLGPPPGPPPALHPLLERVVGHLTTVIGRAFVRADFAEPLALARLACAVGEDDPRAELLGAVLALLDSFEEHAHEPAPDGRPIPPAGRLLVAALIVARTPDVAVPEGAAAPATREEAETHTPEHAEGPAIPGHAD